MSSPLCDMRCACEECEYMQVCDIYHAEYRIQQEAERLEEEYREREYEKMEAL